MEEETKIRKTRISRACENCRTRRIKCQPPYPCVGCRDAGLTDCSVRAKARPMRRRRSQEPTGPNIIQGTGYPERTLCLQAIDVELERVYQSTTGASISLAIEEQNTHPLCDLSSPIPPLPPHPLSSTAALAIRAFTDHMLPFCSYMTSARIIDLFERYAIAPTSLSPDQIGLVLSCLALGYLRLQGFVPGKRAAVYVQPDDRLDVSFYRHAVDVLEKWGSASFTSLHALSGLWFYTTLACTSDATRFMVSWMISQAKELGIHQEQTALAMTYAPSDRADLMFLQVLYSHYWVTALSSHAPLIRPGEFDTMIFGSRPAVDPEVPVALVARRSVTELVLLNTQLLMNFHDTWTTGLSTEWMFRVEDRWAAWCKTWVKEGRTTGNQFSDPFIGVLWDWGRMTIRAATLHDQRFAMSSLAVLARASSQILSRYHDIYLRIHYNLVWQHLRHIVTCAHVVMLCYWRYELTKSEAETSLRTASWILQLMEPRWRAQASVSREKILTVANALGLSVTPLDPSLDKIPLDISSGTTTTPIDGTFNPQAPLGILFEPFDPNLQPFPTWSIDSFFLGNGYS